MSWFIWAFTVLPIAAADPDYVRVRPGAELFSSRDLASGETGRSWAPWNRFREYCQTSGLRAERLGESDGVTALKINIRESGCPYLFRTFDVDYDKVFVRSDQLDAGGAPDQTEAGAREPGCAGCGDRKDPLDNLSKISLLGMLQSKFIKLRAPEKSSAQLEAYLSCYRTKHWDKYDRLYRRLFDVVGREAQVTFEPKTGAVRAVSSPEALQNTLERQDGLFWMHAKPSALKCVTLRESHFDPGARGALTGQGERAVGLAQQMPIAVREMNCVLNGCVLNGEVKPPKAWVRDVWTKIFKSARDEFSPAEYRELMTNARTGRPCLETMAVQERDAACPINSIATLAVAQLQGALLIRRADGRHDGSDLTDYGGQQEYDLTVGIAHGNLAGPTKTRAAIRSTTDTSRWTKAIVGRSGGDEARHNSDALISCLQAENFKPPWPIKPGEKPRDCARVRQAHAE